MLTELLVFRGWGDQGHGEYAHVLGTRYTYFIGFADHGYSPYVQTDSGFVWNYQRGGPYWSDGTQVLELGPATNGTDLEDAYVVGSVGGEALLYHRFATGQGLYLSDGANAPVPILLGDYSASLTVGDAIYVEDDDQIWRIGADHQLTLIADVDSTNGIYEITTMFEFNGELWFDTSAGNSSYSGLYRVSLDGGSATFTGINPGNYFYDAYVAENQFFFWQHTTAHGFELYVSDGTTGGTRLVEDINPGAGNSYHSTAYEEYPITLGDRIFFIANDGGSDGEALWVSDGTEAGTFALTGTETGVGDLSFGQGFQPIVVGNQVFFSTYGNALGDELYVTDGTLAGTRLVIDLVPGLDGSTPENFVTDGTYLYFTVREVSAQGGERSYWRTDGTATGTVIVANPGGTSFTDPERGGIVSIDFDSLPTFDYEGTASADRLLGSFVNERIFGYGGRDQIFGFAGDDILIGNNGEDRLYGGDDNDLLRGANHNDFLSGDNGFDILRGEAGRDILDGGLGNDRLIGGGNTDFFRFLADFGRDVILDFQDGVDFIDFRLNGDVNSMGDLRIITSGTNTIVRDISDANDVIVIRNSAGLIHSEDFVF